MVEKIQEQLSPAQYVIQQIGGVRKTAIVVGRNASAVSRWQVNRDKRGTGGLIPTGVRHLILNYAKEHNLNIKSKHLDFGGPKRVKRTKR